MRFHRVASVNSGVGEGGRVTVVIEHVQPLLMTVRGAVVVSGRAGFAVLQPADVVAVVVIQQSRHAVHELKVFGSVPHFRQTEGEERTVCVEIHHIRAGVDAVAVNDLPRGFFLGRTAERGPVEHGRSFLLDVQVWRHGILPDTFVSDFCCGGKIDDVAVVVVCVSRRCGSELLEVAETGDGASFFSCRVQRGQEHPGEDRDDRDRYYDNLLNIQYGVY